VLPLPDLRDVASFQFHIGTIKSNTILRIYQGFQKFQFHIGTIKRTMAGIGYKYIENFNSTLVRLKVKLKHKTKFLLKISIPHWYD